MTEVLRPDAVDAAIAVLKNGGTLAFPTETVYGLGADATQGDAVARVFAAKNRPAFNPLIVHLADADRMDSLADPTPAARSLARAFWPGPLSLVLPLRPDSPVASLVTAGLDSIALRVPDHALARRLLAAFPNGIAAPSANPSGRISATRADHVLIGLEGRIDAVIDGGATQAGLESTIVDVTGPAPTILRLGAVTAEAIAAILGTEPERRLSADKPDAPGQMKAHYAPAKPLRMNAHSPEPGETMLGFGPVTGALSLSERGDLAEAAARLFDCLHRLDRGPSKAIAVAPIPDYGLGQAINDRLRRASYRPSGTREGT